MKKSTFVLCSAVALAATTLFAQNPTWTSNQTGTYNGYDCELWSENNQGTFPMTLTGDNGVGANAKGGTFTAQWSNTKNILFRCGRKFATPQGGTIQDREAPKPALDYGNMTVDFAATWSSNDDVKVLGVYGWAFYKQASIPSQRQNGQNATFSNQIEYYIVQDRGTYNQVRNQDSPNLCGSNPIGEATIDGIAYEFWICDRIGMNALTGSAVNFKQYFSMPKNINTDRRTSGLISVSEHFKEWAKVGMVMDGPFYEVAMKVESYSQSGASGQAQVTKNILCIGNSCSTNPTPSSSSSGGTNPSVSSSSTVTTSSSSGTGGGDANPTCTDYNPNFCGGAAFSTVIGSTNAIPTAGQCIYIGDFETIQPALNATVSINGVSNTCGADWPDCQYNDKTALTLKDGGYYVYVPNGSSVNAYNNNGWVNVVAKPKPECGDVSPIRLPQIAVENMVSQMNGGIYLQAANNAVVEIFSLSGKKMSSQTFSNGTYSISLGHLPKGMYVVKVSFGSQRKTLNVPVL